MANSYKIEFERIFWILREFIWFLIQVHRFYHYFFKAFFFYEQYFCCIHRFHNVSFIGLDLDSLFFSLDHRFHFWVSEFNLHIPTYLLIGIFQILFFLSLKVSVIVRLLFFSILRLKIPIFIALNRDSFF